MKYISAVIVKNIIKLDCAMMMSLWKPSLCCITAVLGRAFHPCFFLKWRRDSLTAQFLTTPCRYKMTVSCVFTCKIGNINHSALENSIYIIEFFFSQNPYSRCFIWSTFNPTMHQISHHYTSWKRAVSFMTSS